MARRTFIDTANAARLLPKVEGLDLGAGDVPIFSTLAAAEAWEAANPGKTALTLEPSTPDTTPPTPGVLSVTPAHTSAALSVSGASDDRAVAEYAFKVGAGAWSAWQAGSTYTATGLSASTAYSFQHRVRDRAGNEALGTAVSATTTAAPVVPLSTLAAEDGAIHTVLFDTGTPKDTGAQAVTWTPTGAPTYAGGALVLDGASTLTATGTGLHGAEAFTILVVATAQNTGGAYSQGPLAVVPSDGTSRGYSVVRTSTAGGNSAAATPANSSPKGERRLTVVRGQVGTHPLSIDSMNATSRATGAASVTVPAALDTQGGTMTIGYKSPDPALKGTVEAVILIRSRLTDERVAAYAASVGVKW